MKIIAQVIYTILIRTKSVFLEKVLLKIRKIMLRFYNPLISVSHNGFRLKMPFSHTIFYYQEKFPNYDANLHTIASYIKEKNGVLNMIDVGANIGDTVIFTNILDARYLMIEGEKSYANLIKENIICHYANKGGGQRIMLR